MPEPNFEWPELVFISARMYGLGIVIAGLTQFGTVAHRANNGIEELGSQELGSFAQPGTLSRPQYGFSLQQLAVRCPLDGTPATSSNVLGETSNKLAQLLRSSPRFSLKMTEEGCVYFFVQDETVTTCFGANSMTDTNRLSSFPNISHSNLRYCRLRQRHDDGHGRLPSD
ncbi:hypothetical protein BGZ63DRAFT_464020 [Mariannaea sp. PMI_226]|nr:hypothetical protein BGZ63DRAFT_464020 [Mariannaea sp. PMI_226]